MYTFNIILSMNDGEQEIFDIDMNDENVENEVTFLYSIFSELSDIEINNLCKISVFQYGVENFLDYIIDSDGKFYFTSEDPYLLNIRDLYISQRREQRNFINVN